MKGMFLSFLSLSFSVVVSCPPGTFINSLGNCEKCPDGMICEPFSLPVNCPQGFFCKGGSIFTCSSIAQLVHIL